LPLEISDERGGSALAGFGSAKGSNEEAYLFQKFIRQGFGTNNVDHCTRLCRVGSGAVSAPFTDSMKSDCMIVIGARPAQNHPVAATYLKQAAKQGKKLIIMDPRGQDLMHDEQYIQANASGFDALKEKVKDFSPEVMSEVCGIAPEVLRDVARVYATSERSIIFWGMGVSQHTHGTDNARCFLMLGLSR